MTDQELELKFKGIFEQLKVLSDRVVSLEGKPKVEFKIPKTEKEFLAMIFEEGNN